MSLVDWFLQSSIAERAILFVLVLSFLVVMYGSFRSLTGSHQHVTWYRGIHATPVFQVLMWLGALPLVVPAAYLMLRRRRALATAPYIGNLRSRIFHVRECEYQQRINTDFLRFPLSDPKRGVELGFKPCNWCIR